MFYLYNCIVSVNADGAEVKNWYGAEGDIKGIVQLESICVCIFIYFYVCVFLYFCTFIFLHFASLSKKMHNWNEPVSLSFLTVHLTPSFVFDFWFLFISVYSKAAPLHYFVWVVLQTLQRNSPMVQAPLISWITPGIITKRPT